MKSPLLLLSFCLVFPWALRADDLTSNAQAALKDQGFYYGEVDGNLNAATAAAIKRFQIRNGLEANGTLDNAVIDALGLREQPAPPAAAQPVPGKSPAQVPPAIAPPVAPSVLPPQLPPKNAQYPGIFYRTPYANAPEVVQRGVIESAQALLSRQGFYRAPIDGVAGPVFFNAVAGYQRQFRLPVTARLDLETLSHMRLLPGLGGAPVQSGPRPGSVRHRPQ